MTDLEMLQASQGELAARVQAACRLPEAIAIEERFGGITIAAARLESNNATQFQLRYEPYAEPYSTTLSGSWAGPLTATPEQAVLYAHRILFKHAVPHTLDMKMAEVRAVFTDAQLDEVREPDGRLTYFIRSSFIPVPRPYDHAFNAVEGAWYLAQEHLKLIKLQKADPFALTPADFVKLREL